MGRVHSQIGSRIRALRQAKGMSQMELADSSGIHPSHMGKIERGECDVTVATLYRLGRGLRTPMSVLVRGIEGPSKL